MFDIIVGALFLKDSVARFVNESELVVTEMLLRHNLVTIVTLGAMLAPSVVNTV